MSNRLVKVFVVGFTFLFLFSIASAQEQTEDQKRLMDLHKKNLVQKKQDQLGKDGKSIVDEVYFDLKAAGYLLHRKRGVAAVEDAIAEYAAPIAAPLKGKGSVVSHWLPLLEVYEQRIAIEDMPDKVIPAFVFRFEREAAVGQAGQGIYRRAEQAAEFGPRGKAFIPHLEKLRDDATDAAVRRYYKGIIDSIKQ